MSVMHLFRSPTLFATTTRSLRSRHCFVTTKHLTVHYRFYVTSKSRPAFTSSSPGRISTRFLLAGLALFGFAYEYKNRLKSPANSAFFWNTGAKIPISTEPSSFLEVTKHLRTMTPEDVSQILRSSEKKITVLNSAVGCYHVNAVPSNNPIEDEQSAYSMQGRGNLWGVYDGHGGWFCSQKVAAELPLYVSRALDACAITTIGNSIENVNKVTQALKSAFLNLDKDIINVEPRLGGATKSMATSILLPALAGSCALLAFVTEDHLFVACAGDSRAVLGVKDPTSGDWVAHSMSIDQTGRNEDEVQRLKAEHPGEENVIMRGRILGGLEPTRAFGDARYKWTAEEQDRIFEYMPKKRQMPKEFKSPPYVTALPEVTHRKLQSNDRFLIMATDGLWDRLSSDEVVNLVGAWLDGIEDKDFNISLLERKQYTFIDSNNASTHVIRNALGGADEEKIATLLSIPSPASRAYRDDISCTILFFGGDEKGLQKMMKAKL